MAVLTFGDFAFEVQDGPETFEETRPYSFSEHALIGTKPALQAMGAGLRTIPLSVRWSAALHYPGTYWDNLTAMADRQEAAALVWGTGRVEGTFVITELQRTLLQLTVDGRILLMEARITLKEYVEREPLVAMERRQKVAAGKRKGSTLPKGPGYPTTPPGSVPPATVTRKAN